MQPCRGLDGELLSEVAGGIAGLGFTIIYRNCRSSHSAAGSCFQRVVCGKYIGSHEHLWMELGPGKH